MLPYHNYGLLLNLFCLFSFLSLFTKLPDNIIQGGQQPLGKTNPHAPFMYLQRLLVHFEEQGSFDSGVIDGIGTESIGLAAEYFELGCE